MSDGPGTAAPRAVNVLLVAEEAAGLQTLRALQQTSHRVVGVVTTVESGPFRGATVRNLAVHLGCATWPSAVVRDPDFAATVRELQADVLLNVHSVFVIHAAVLQAPAIGCFNMHPGPLPEYAGLNAVSWAIYRGERRHAVTIHWMAPEIDTGPVAYDQAVEIDQEDTGLTLSAKCVRAGVPLLLELLDTAARDPGAVPARRQDLSRRRYHGREVPEQGGLRWTWPARQVVDFVRACDFAPLPSPWGLPRARLGDCVLHVAKATRTHRSCTAPPGTVGEPTDRGVLVATADEWVAVSRLELEGRRIDSAGVLRAGQRLADG